MQIYLPIAELSVNVLVLLGLGGAVGFLSGMFGVGGGFLMTPLLIFLGIPPAVAVATEANQIAASSVSGVLSHWRRNTVDFKIGSLLLAGGIIGSACGVTLFRILTNMGQIDVVISLSYILFLGIIGFLMLIESLRTMQIARKGGRLPRRKPGQHTWVHGLPLRMRFPRSKIYISAIPVLVLGFGVGVLAAVMGVGGGFVMVPAMIYLLKMPTNVVVGTSLFQIIFVTAFTSVLHSVTNHTVDFVLALLLLIGGVIGAQIGVRVGQRMRGESLRLLLALLVLSVCFRLVFELVSRPSELFSLTQLVGH